jgi:hypothetical protein
MKNHIANNIKYSTFVAVVESNGVIKKTLVEPFIFIEDRIKQDRIEIESMLGFISSLDSIKDDNNEKLKAACQLYLNKREVVDSFNEFTDSFFAQADDMCAFMIIHAFDENDADKNEHCIEFFAANSLKQGLEMMSSYANFVFVNSVSRTSAIDIGVKNDRLVIN